MPRPGIIPNSFGSIFSTALWELGLGMSPADIILSLMDLFPGAVPPVPTIAFNLALQASYAGAGLMGLTPIPWGGPAPIPSVAGITGGYYYDVVCTFLDETTDDVTDRLLRVQSDSPLTTSEIYGKAFDQAVYFSNVQNYDRFANLDLESKRGQTAIECRVVSAFHGIG